MIISTGQSDATEVNQRNLIAELAHCALIKITALFAELLRDIIKDCGQELNERKHVQLKFRWDGVDSLSSFHCGRLRIVESHEASITFMSSQSCIWRWTEDGVVEMGNVLFEVALRFKWLSANNDYVLWIQITSKAQPAVPLILCPMCWMDPSLAIEGAHGSSFGANKQRW